MDKKQLLRSVRSKEYNTLDELVTEAARIIPHIAQEQRRYKVSVYPDERTIRYYINEGLVDRPSSSKDKPSRFTYRHLLQILTIKHLQAEYLPLTKIKGMLAGLNESRMEELIIGGNEDSLEYSRISSPLRRRQALHCDISEHSVAYSPESIPLYSRRVPDRLYLPEEWLRISVAEDVEINIRASSVPKTHEEKKEFMERIAAKLRIYLEQEKKQGGI